MRFSTPPEEGLKSFQSLRIKSCGRFACKRGEVMKSFQNVDVRSIKEAVSLLQKFHGEKKSAQVVSGGSELLQLMKDHVAAPDYLVNLKTIPRLNYIKEKKKSVV